MRPATAYLGSVEIRKYGQGAAEELLLYPHASIRISKTKPSGAVVSRLSALHRDAQGAVRALTTAAGVQAENTLYRPYGEETIDVYDLATAPETKGYIGERFDADAGLQYLNARYYDPKLAMFLQPDWWEVTQSGVGTNRYAYAGGDPINGTDAGGHGWLKNVIKAVENFLRATPDAALKSTINSVDAARDRAVSDAWKMETQLVQRTGTGTRNWSKAELELLKEGKRVPGYVGDHITSVSADITKAADHRNIEFLTTADHDARHKAVGGTRVPISEDRLIDRTLGGQLPDLATEGAKSWARRAGDALAAIADSRAMAVIDLLDPTTYADEVFRQQYGYSFSQYMMSECIGPLCT